MDAFEKKVGIAKHAQKDDSYYRVIGIENDQKPVLQSDILDFWSPLGFFPGYPEGYEIGLCRIKAPFTNFNYMEQHLQSCEVLIPLNGDMFVPLAPPGPDPIADRMVIMPVRLGELICLGEGAWHFAGGPLGGGTLDYFVILRRSTPQKDLVKKSLGCRIVIEM